MRPIAALAFRKLLPAFLLLISRHCCSCFAAMNNDPTSTEWGTATRTPTSPLDVEGVDWPEGDALEDCPSVDVAVVGAGPAGLAAAIGLSRRLHGPEVRVYERAPRLRESSQGMLSLWPNGMTYLGKIHSDLPALVTDAGCAFESTTFVKINGDGGVTETRSELEPGTVLIRWHALQRVLSSLLPDGTLVTGRSLVAYKEMEDCVLLRFEYGTIIRARIVIGADGTFSSVRQIMHPSDRPIYFGQMNWNVIVPTSSLPANARPPPNGVKSISYDGETRWSSFINDCGAGHTFFQLRITDEDKARSLSASKGRGGMGLPGVKRALLPVVEPSADVANILRALPEERIFERAIVGRLPASTWRSPGGRVALLGDAAHGMHPNMGQGANSALGSAVALVEGLAECYGDGNGANGSWDVEGLERYERNRRPRVDWVHRIANMMGCGQASGETWLDREARSMWFRWPQNTDDAVPPPLEGREVVRAFDPLSRPEVSLL